MKQTFKRFGVDIELRLLEPGTNFENGLERQYEAMIFSRSTNPYPDPHQYFHTDFLSTTNNNNIWAFGTAYTDSLIGVYRFDLDRERRLQAMHELDQVLQDEAFIVPFWYGPFIRHLAWDHVQFPEFYYPKRANRLLRWQVMWIDTDREEAMRLAMKEGRSLSEEVVVDIDPYDVKKRIDAASSGAAPSGS